MFQPIRMDHVIVSTYSMNVPWSHDESWLFIHIMWTISQSHDIKGSKLEAIKYSVRDMRVHGAIGARSKGWTKKKSNEREYNKKWQDFGWALRLKVCLIFILGPEHKSAFPFFPPSPTLIMSAPMIWCLGGDKLFTHHGHSQHTRKTWCPGCWNLQGQVVFQSMCQTASSLASNTNSELRDLTNAHGCTFSKLYNKAPCWPMHS